LCAAGAGMLMGQDQPAQNAGVVGVTSFDTQDYHVAVAWGVKQGSLVVLGTGALPLKEELGFAALRTNIGKIAANREEQDKILEALDSADNTKDFGEAKKGYQAVLSALPKGSCRQCDEELDRCFESCKDRSCINRCFGRYVVCVLTNCR